MSPARIEELVEMIPRRAPYLNRVSLHTHRLYGISAVADIRAASKNEPRFGWLFVKSFLDTGQRMPPEVHESDLVRAYGFGRYDFMDQAVVGALELEHGSNWQRRVILKCLLLMEDCRFEKISQLMLLPEEVVAMYESLFWNVRDQVKDRIYVNMLVYPNSRQVELAPRYALEEDPASIALRASRNNDIKTTLAWLGIDEFASEFGSESHAKAFEARILSTGNFLAKLGFLHQADVIAIQSARSVLNSIKLGGGEQKDDDSRRGLSGMSLALSMNESFMRIMKPELERRLAVQRGLETDNSSEAPGDMRHN